MKEELTIKVVIGEVFEAKGSKDVARMINFTGESDCENFKGVILPGGVDTQKEIDGEKFLLSARYMLKGTDKAGKECSIFIENNGEAKIPPAEIITRPVIITDSEALAYLEDADLEGTIEPWEKGVIIHIFSK
ncbi:MAG: DUF3237 family protein [Pseudobutyrivibrio sp.]|nr:DUF3237 family protein [Pseudobutyrivibrio sp.]MCF0185067.1 DUF3237 family protein [Bacteroidaceae bacterium]